MRIYSALLCFAVLVASSVASGQDADAFPPLPLRILDAASAAPIPSTEIFTPSGVLLTLGDAQGFASIPISAADSVFLTVHADGYGVDTLWPPFREEVFLRPASRALEEVVVRPGVAMPVTPSRRDAVIDYCFVGNYLLVATTRSPRKSTLQLLSLRGTTVARAELRDEPDGVFTACDGTPYVIFSYLNRFQPVSSAEGMLQVGKHYPMRLLAGVQACQLAHDDALYYRSFSPEDFSFLLWRWRAADTAPRIFVERNDTAAARASAMEYGGYNQTKHKIPFHYGSSLESEMLRLLRNRNVCRELMGNLMLLRDTLLLPDFRTRRLVHYSAEGKELMAPAFQFRWGSIVQFALLQDAATGRIFLHRYGRAFAQTVQELDPRTGALIGREVRIEKPFAEKITVRDGRLYYLWQDDVLAAAQQLFTQPLTTSR